MRYLTFTLLAFFAAGCCGNGCKSETSTRYHEDGMAKPVAALPAMIDTTSFDVPWSLSEEITSSIAGLISKGGKIFIQAQEDFAIASNPFAGDLSWMKREFQNQEFAVFLELAEHELVPTNKGNEFEASNNLIMGVRVRVVDLRGPEPKVVLQEMVRQSYYIPRTLFPVDYDVAAWGTDEYKKSPMATAHHQLAQELAARITDYILLAKSR